MSGEHLRQLRRTADTTDGWSDAFRNQVSGRTNVLDLAGHYPYSPERWRVRVDGSRVFPEYGSVAQYTHAGDYHELSPAAGETVDFVSAERPRYVVQYELAATWAFAVNQSLQSGDSIRVGLYDPDSENGWYMEHTGDHADDATGDFVLERGGTEVYRRSDQDLQKDVLTNARLKLQTGWYDVTRQRWERSFSNSGRQENPAIVQTGNDDARGSETGNLPVYFSVTASGSTSNLVLEAGSAAQVNLGTTTELRREKSFTTTVSLDTTGTWVPLFGVRENPDRDIINTQLSEFRILGYSGDELDLLIQSHAPENVTDSGGNPLEASDWGYPVETSPTNSAIQTTSAVDQAADGTGTVVASTSNPGGYQVGYAVQRVTGTGSKESTETSKTDSKRAIYGQDVAVVWANGDTATDITFELRTEQDW